MRIARVPVLSSILVLSLVALLAPIDSARASLITWTFQGTVRDIQSNSAGLPSDVSLLGIAVGDTVSGFVRFETDTPDYNAGKPGAGTHYYLDATREGEVSVGAWSAVSTSPSTIVVFTDDAFGANSESLYVNTSAPGGTGLTSGFGLELVPVSSLWPGSPMLVTPPPLAELVPYGSGNSSHAVHGTDALVYFGTAGYPNIWTAFHAELTSLERVPEPSAAALELLASLALVSYRSRVRRIAKTR